METSQHPRAGAAAADGRRAWRADAAVGLVCLGLLYVFTFNAWHHDARIGYDQTAHYGVAVAMSQGRLPTPADTTEFHSAPLSYVPMAALLACGVELLTAAKIVQWLQVIYAAVLLVHLRWLMRLAGAGPLAAITALLVLATAGAWWRSFAFVRPEPLLAMLVVMAVYHTARLFTGPSRPEGRSVWRHGSPWWRIILAGALWGLCPLARQWGVFAMLGAVPTIVAYTWAGRLTWRQFAVAAGLACLIPAPYYVAQTVRYRTLTPFNVDVSERATLSWTFDPLAVADSPTHPGLLGRPLQIFYADLYGDYGMYWVVWGRSKDAGWLSGSKLIEAFAKDNVKRSNLRQARAEIKPVLLASLGVTALGVIAVAVAVICTALLASPRRRAAGDGAGPAEALSVAVLLATLAGYAWFVLAYTQKNGDTDTVKPTYVLQAWPLAAVLVAVFAERCRRAWRPAAWGLLALAAATVVVNIGMIFTRYYR